MLNLILKSSVALSSRRIPFRSPVVADSVNMSHIRQLSQKIHEKTTRPSLAHLRRTVSREFKTNSRTEQTAASCDRFIRFIFKDVELSNPTELRELTFLLLLSQAPHVLTYAIETERLHPNDGLSIYEQLIKEENFSIAEKLIGYKGLFSPNLFTHIKLALVKGNNYSSSFVFVRSGIERGQLTVLEAGDLFKLLIEKKEILLANLLLGKYELPSEDFQRGLFIGIETNQDPWVSDLLKNYQKNPDYFKGVFQELIRRKKSELAIHLLGNPQLTHTDLLAGLDLALEAQDLDFVKKIIETKKLEKTVAGEVFHKLIRLKQRFLAQDVVRCCQLSEQDFTKGLFLAIENKQIYLAQSLIRDLKNIGFPLEGAFQKMIEKEEYGLGLAFVQARQISDDDFIEGVMEALEKNGKDFIQKLIEINKLKQTAYTAIFRRLARNDSETAMDNLQWLVTAKTQSNNHRTAKKLAAVVGFAVASLAGVVMIDRSNIDLTIFDGKMKSIRDEFNNLWKMVVTQRLSRSTEA